MANNNNSYKSRYSGEQVDSAVGKAQRALTEDDIVQTTGQYANKVMSQAAVSTLMENAATNQNIANAIENHNVSSTSHQDIRNAVNQKPNAINYRADSLFDTYTTKFINDNFAPISYVSNLYANKTDTTGLFRLTNEAPELDNNNTYTTSSINNDFNYSVPELILYRIINATTTIGLNNSFEIDLQFTLDRDETLSFAGRIEYSTDYGTTWEAISTNQATSSELWQGSSGGTIYGNTVRFNIQTDLVTSEITLYRNMLIRVLIFKKQDNTSTLETTYYFGVPVDNTPIYTFIKFNFANVYINTNQIANGSITEIKLDASLRNKINDATKPNVETFTLSTSDWIQLSDKEPFTYYTEKPITSTITEHTIVELINDNPIEFYNNGYAILSVSGQVAVIGCVTLPDSPIQVKIMTYETNEVQNSLLTPEIYVDNLNVLTITNFSSYENSTEFHIYAMKVGTETSNPITEIYKEDGGTDTLDLTPFLEYAGEYNITCIAVDNGVVSASSEEASATINPGLYYWYWDENNNEEVLTFIKGWDDMVTDEEILLDENDPGDIVGASFSGYQANRLLIDSSITTITNMRNANISEIYIPCEVTEIGNQAFMGCPAQNVYFEDYGQEVYFGTNVFVQSNLQIVPRLPKSNSTIPQGFMNLCSNVSELSFWFDNIETIGTQAFENVTIGQYGSSELWMQYVKSIDSSAFKGVSGITDIYLSTELNTIYDYAFSNMGNVVIHYSGTQAQWNNVNKVTYWDANTNISMSYEDDGFGGE